MSMEKAKRRREARRWLKWPSSPTSHVDSLILPTNRTARRNLCMAFASLKTSSSINGNFANRFIEIALFLGLFSFAASKENHARCLLRSTTFQRSFCVRCLFRDKNKAMHAWPSNTDNRLRTEALKRKEKKRLRKKHLIVNMFGEALTAVDRHEAAGICLKVRLTRFERSQYKHFEQHWDYAELFSPQVYFTAVDASQGISQIKRFPFCFVFFWWPRENLGSEFREWSALRVFACAPVTKLKRKASRKLCPSVVVSKNWRGHSPMRNCEKPKSSRSTLQLYIDSQPHRTIINWGAFSYQIIDNQIETGLHNAVISDAVSRSGKHWTV